MNSLACKHRLGFLVALLLVIGLGTNVTFAQSKPKCQDAEPSTKFYIHDHTGCYWGVLRDYWQKHDKKFSPSEKPLEVEIRVFKDKGAPKSDYTSFEWYKLHYYWSKVEAYQASTPKKGTVDEKELWVGVILTFDPPFWSSVIAVVAAALLALFFVRRLGAMLRRRGPGEAP